jgi:hypothetical protein
MSEICPETPQASPGLAAWAAFCQAAPGEVLATPGRWDAKPQVVRDAWEAAAEAAIGAGPNAPRRLAAGNQKLRTERDQALGVNENLRRQLAAAKADLADTRERLENLAVGMEMSAAGTSPSKKSEIERQCAQAVREIAERPF